jgi:hypothetical protein
VLAGATRRRCQAVGYALGLAVPDRNTWRTSRAGNITACAVAVGLVLGDGGGLRLGGTEPAGSRAAGALACGRRLAAQNLGL